MQFIKDTFAWIKANPGKALLIFAVGGVVVLAYAPLRVWFAKIAGKLPKNTAPTS